MSERKVLNKYYPPDFDPSKIPRLRLPKNRQYTVRIMAPCNMRCNTCGDYIARGKKFNARKETVESEEYLGLKVFRFYFKCPVCMQEITFKTDPKNYDYIVEHGATPNFKALKMAQQQAIEEQKEIDEEERLNPMKLLENRTKASRREMENLEALEDLKELSQREVVIDYEGLLCKKKEEFEAEMKRQEEEDERFVQSIFGGNSKEKDQSKSKDHQKNSKWKSLGTLAEQDEFDEDDDDDDEGGFDDTDDIELEKNKPEPKIDEDGDEIIEEFDFKYPLVPTKNPVDVESSSKESFCTDNLLNDNSAVHSSSSSITTTSNSSSGSFLGSNNNNNNRKRTKSNKLSNLVVIKKNKNDEVATAKKVVISSSDSKPSLLSSLCSYSDSDNSD